MTVKYVSRQIEKIKQYDANLADKINEQYGFLSSGDVERLSEFLPKHMLLVRCGNGRFITSCEIGRAHV